MARTEDSDETFPPLPGDVMRREVAEPAAEPAASPRTVTLREEEAEVVRPTVERAILLSGQQDRAVLGSALASVVGTALRRSITGVLKRFVLRINSFFVLTFSAEGIRWRFEAFRTGKPFQQVVREHSLTCPVTQVFLIHRRTGLMIGQVKQKDIRTQDGDMVSSMLTAIQDFVHDSFRTEAAGQLEVIRIGDVTVLLEQGPLAILAGIITQGFAPQNLRQTFRRALEQIHEDYHEALVKFRGDTDLFQDVDPVLDACLKTRLVKGEDKISPLTLVVLAVPLVMLMAWGFFEMRQGVRWRHYLTGLTEQPGVLVVETGRRGTFRYVRGLRDPLAADPVALLADAGIVPEDVVSEWRPYQALDPELVLERARRMLNPPDTVTLELRGGTLFVEGSAPWHWVDDAPIRVAHVLGISEVRTDGVKRTDVEQQRSWELYLRKLAETPGILVLEKGRWNGAFYIAGMHDPMAPDPVAMLAEAGLGTTQVRSKWESFQALHPTLTLQRAKKVLAPPRSVSMSLDKDVLKVEGTASHAWITKARLLASGLAGISRLHTEELTDVDYEAYTEIVPLLEGEVFYFLVNRRDLWPGQEKRFRTFVENVARFARVARRLGGGYHIEIRGHTRASDDDEIDMSASEAIAEQFYSRLQNQRVAMELFVKRGMGGNIAPAAAKADAQKREAHVSFHVRSDD
jgi:hypothetical protein